MDLREGQNITRPPLLEGNNYGYWRVRMKAFLKSQDESVWEAVEDGWSPPVVTKDDEVTPLPKDKWTVDHKIAEAANSKAMNAIFSGVNGKNFKMISACEIAKKAWDILRTAHEGTSKVKISRMETVTSKFENLRMQEDETIADFNTRVLDISNEAFALGEPLTKETLVRKVLRSLTKRFTMKALAVKESNDVKTMRLDELMGSLQTHETDINEEDRLTKDKSFGLKVEVSVVPDKMGDLSEQQFALFAKNFGRFMRKQYDKGTDSGQSSNPRFHKDAKYQKGNQSGDQNQDNIGKGIQCRECEGYGHIRAECINTKKKKNVYFVSWSNSESDQEGESNNFIALTGCVNQEEDSKSSSEELTQYSSCENNEETPDEDFTRKYKELFHEWQNEVEQNKLCLNNLADLAQEKGKLWEEADVLVTQKVELQQTITDLQAQLTEAKDERANLLAQKSELLAVISSLKLQINRTQGIHPDVITDLKKKNAALKRQEVILLNTIDALKIEIEIDKENHVETLEELNHLKKSIKMLNSCPVEALEADEDVPTTFERGESSSYVVPEQHHTLRKSVWYPIKRQDKRRCYYCNQVGHIKSRCPDFHSSLRKMSQCHGVLTSPIMQVWKVKDEKEVWHVAFSSRSLPEKQRWYFDSGCSRHMTGNQEFLTKVAKIEGRSVIFGDGIEGQVLGKGTLKVPGLPSLQNVFLVKGLQANLISISQLCDGENHVHFTQDKCVVQNNQNEIVLTGRIAANNCYLVDLNRPTDSTTCMLNPKRGFALKHCCHRVKSSKAWVDHGCVRRGVNTKSKEHLTNSSRSEFTSCYTKLLWKKSMLNGTEIESCYTKLLWQKSLLEEHRVEQHRLKQQRDRNILRFRTQRSPSDLCATNN
ncbi:unnamed protein product [Rhodiola kirilowii]